MRYMDIKTILRETADRIENLYVPYEDEYRVRIKYLNWKEKDILRKFLMEHDWNLGSAKVLAMLKNAGIITASEYVLCNAHSKDTTQQVMNDLLETEHTLLAELFTNSILDISISTSLKEVLQDSLSSALDDLIEKPNVIPCNYLKRLGSHLQTSELTMLRIQHMQLLLGKDCSVSIEEAFGFQQYWRSEINERKDTILGQLMMEIVQDKINAIETLFAAVKTLKRTISWKYFLQLLHLLSIAIGEDKEEIFRLKVITKELFNKVIQDSNFEQFLLLILTAREICAANANILGEYSNWYKTVLGEMSYRISKPQFILVMEMMTKLISFESSLECLRVHVTISISSPPKCMDLVVTYKQLCRAQLVKLENQTEEQPGQEHEISIVIDDDD
ncbi:uncharacterized protein LOC131694096 [Topomyia yanbarensis]|uniref:uncharacterized protein LOC131694096 n=1 Tax=Topomyia yanbarensis TaxID=2498891 RepID=UPI00273BD22A|nr:uncharacterized protein LOC131694096 [Topomyia yanbarensis]